MEENHMTKYTLSFVSQNIFSKIHRYTRLLVFMGILGVMIMVCHEVVAQHPKLHDKDITLAVQQKLLLHEAVSAHLIDVETHEGIVTLSGEVDHLPAKNLAVTIAEGVIGVRSVINQLKVHPVTRTDEDIRQDVEEALKMDPVTDSYEVDVAVSDGIVTLSGTVHSQSEKKLVAQIVEGVKGVKELQNTLTLAYQKEWSDETIRRKIERRLSGDPYIDGRLIDISVEDGNVALSGVVGSMREKALIRDNAWVPGVKAVDETGLRIEWWVREDLRRPILPMKTDEEIQQAVQDALFYDPRVSVSDLDIAVDTRTVSLTGIVENLKAKKAAEQDAKNTIGVKRVKNYLSVRPLTSLTDNEIAQQVQDALLRDSLLERHHITVNVRNNKVYLSGSVDTYYEKWLSEDIASRVKGVVAIQNSLVVNYVWDWKSDQEIKEDVESELFWSWAVDSDEVTVTVDDGNVILTGKVESWHELDAAINNAFEGGAKTVKSYLKVEHEVGEYPIFRNRRYYH
jgi:osmotically-inducible protein OsmY